MARLFLPALFACELRRTFLLGLVWQIWFLFAHKTARLLAFQLWPAGRVLPPPLSSFVILLCFRKETITEISPPNSAFMQPHRHREGAPLFLKSSAELHSAVSPICNRQASGFLLAFRQAGRFAGCKPALQQITNLRYWRFIAARQRGKQLPIRDPDPRLIFLVFHKSAKICGLAQIFVDGVL